MTPIRKIPLAKKLDVTPRTVTDRAKSGALPPPFYLNGIPYWDWDEIEALFQKRMAERRAVNLQAT
ncbi:MAG: hypothetical protein WAV38_28145 [Xanthobacteraceae bacterium]